MESLVRGVCNQEFEAPTTFPLQRLPLELQLQILHHMLTSPAPILNAGIPLSRQMFLVEDEEKGQDHIDPCMIFTCKHFYKEGLPLLYRRNTFTYSEPESTISHLLCGYDSRNCQRCAKSESQPSTSTCHRYHNVALPANAANVHLRLPTTQVFAFLDNCQLPLHFVNSFASLRFLRLDFFEVGNSSLWEEGWVQAQCEEWIQTLGPDFAKTVKELNDPNRSAGALKEILITGLPKNVISLYVVRQYVRLLAADGRIGVGWEAKAKQYGILNLLDTGDHGDMAERGDPKTLWMNVVEAGEWIARKYPATGSNMEFWS